MRSADRNPDQTDPAFQQSAKTFHCHRWLSSWAVHNMWRHYSTVDSLGALHSKRLRHWKRSFNSPKAFSIICLECDILVLYLNTRSWKLYCAEVPLRNCSLTHSPPVESYQYFCMGPWHVAVAEMLNLYVIVATGKLWTDSRLASVVSLHRPSGRVHYPGTRQNSK